MQLRMTNRTIKGSLAIGAGFLLGTTAITGCSSSESTSSASASASASSLSLTAACQELATVVNTLLGPSITEMSQPPQSEALEAGSAKLQTMAASLPPDLRADVEAFIGAIPAVVAANSPPPTSADGSPPKTLSSEDVKAGTVLDNAAESIGNTCNTVNVTIG